MILKEADLTIKKIYINGCYFTAIPRSEDYKTTSEIPLGTDFVIKHPSKEVGRTFNVVMEIYTTDHKDYVDVPGYHFSVLCEGQFGFTGRLTKKKKNDYIYNSGLAIMISYIRGYLSNISSYGMYGQYILPSVDLTALITEKIKESRERQDLI